MNHALLWLAERGAITFFLQWRAKDCLEHLGLIEQKKNLIRYEESREMEIAKISI